MKFQMQNRYLIYKLGQEIRIEFYILCWSRSTLQITHNAYRRNTCDHKTLKTHIRNEDSQVPIWLYQEGHQLWGFIGWFYETCIFVLGTCALTLLIWNKYISVLAAHVCQLHTYIYKNTTTQLLLLSGRWYGREFRGLKGKKCFSIFHQSRLPSVSQLKTVFLTWHIPIHCKKNEVPSVLLWGSSFQCVDYVYGFCHDSLIYTMLCIGSRARSQLWCRPGTYKIPN